MHDEVHERTHVGEAKGLMCMKRLIQIGLYVTVICIFLIGCSDDTFDSNTLDDYKVKHSEAEVEEGDFTFRLVSVQETYQEGEEVELYGEIIYTGNESSLTIGHASEAIIFPMKEKVRNYDLSAGVNDIAIETKLKKDEPYKIEYTKNGVGYSEEDPPDYQTFVKDFMKRDDFPAGYYEVYGEADFYVKEEHIQMEAVIDFKVTK